MKTLTKEIVKNLTNAYKHFRKIQTHRKWVRYYCFKLGLYWQGITHDLTKYSPIEFLESIKYYQGKSSPIIACKKAKGYSLAWLHHRGRNKHHWEMWTDNYSTGTIPLEMPKKYLFEMICDWCGAARAYQGEDNFSFEEEYQWYVNKSMLLHPKTRRFCDEILLILCQKGEKAFNLFTFTNIYNKIHKNFFQP